MIRAVVGAVRRAQDGVSPWLACLGPVLVMLREHGEIWALLDALDTDVAAGTSAARLAQTFAQLEEALEQHNLKEERILYPAGDQVLDATVAEAVRGALSDGLMPADWVCEMFDR